MKRIYYILPTIALALFATVLASCSDSDDAVNTVSGEEPVQFFGAFNGGSVSTAAKTRVVDDQWEVNDAVGISGGNYYNTKYTATEAGAMTQLAFNSGKEIMFSTEIPKFSLTAYYPYTYNHFYDYEDTLVGMKEQQTMAMAKKYDFMYAAAEAERGSVVNFNFTHKMCRVIFKFVDGENVTLKNHRWYLANAIRLRGTFEPYNGKIQVDKRSLPGVEDTVGNIHYPNVPDTLFFFPQTPRAGTLVLYHKTYPLPNEDPYYFFEQTYKTDITLPELESGKSVELKFSVNDQRIRMVGFTINDWNDTAQPDVSATDMQ